MSRTPAQQPSASCNASCKVQQTLSARPRGRHGMPGMPGMPGMAGDLLRIQIQAAL